METFYETIKIDELVKSLKSPVIVIPAKIIVIPVKTGIQENQPVMDSRSPIGVEDKLSGSDGFCDFLRDHQDLIWPRNEKVLNTMDKGCPAFATIHYRLPTNL